MSFTGTIGLTGGIACGKSEVAAILKQLDVPVLDTDAVAHKLLEPGHWVYEKVVQAFGAEFVLEEGGINRRKLGAHVFTSKAAREKLNAIMHPEVYAEVDRWLNETLLRNDHAIAMIPLLYETKSEGRFSKVIVVASDKKDIEQRLLARGLSIDEARSRVKAQMPVEEKVSRADAVIWNNGDLQDLKKETINIWIKDILGKEITS